VVCDQVFMKRLKSLSSMNNWVAAGILAASLCWQVRADTVFDNTGTDLGSRFNQGKLEFGNEFLPSSSSPSMAITNFAFEYFSLHNGSTFNSSMRFRVDVRLYINDGPVVGGLQSPGSLIFDTGTINMTGATAGSILNFDSLNDFSYDNNGYYSSTYGGLWVPSSAHLTWTVQFSNLATGDSAGIELYSPPSTGSEYSEYWLNSGGTWALEVNTNGLPATGGAIMDATPVPEPGILSLSALGALSLVAASRRRQRK